MKSGSGQRLTVEARLLADPCLWCWEIRDAQHRLVESSWANSLDGLSLPGGGVGGRHQPTIGQPERVRHLRGGMTPGQGVTT